jgi:hypothetical protein
MSLSLTFLFASPGTLPPYPMRVACSHISSTSYPSDTALLEALRDAVSVFHNATAVPCFDINVIGNNETTLDGKFWGYIA